MLVIPGRRCHTCEGPTRRELLRAGSIGMLGLNLANFLGWQKSARAAAKYEGARGFGSANSVIMVFLQGGPSHIDLWDPKPDAPANIRGEFKSIPTKIPGTHIGEHMPMMANALDKATLIRSMSYTPNGLFNHTAAIYQMLTGYPPDLEKALKSYAIDEYYAKAFDLVLSGKARDAFDLTKEPDQMRERYGKTTFGQGLLLSRRLIEAGTRFVQMNWPSVANGNPEVDSWDTHAANFSPLKNLHCPKLDRGLSALLEDMNDRGMLKQTLVVAIGEFGRSPRIGVSTSGNSNAPDGRDHWPYCYSAVVAGCGIARGAQYGESDQTASSPKDKPVHPNDLLATVYYALGIDPDMIVLNHLNQPRELVKGKVVSDLWS